MPLDAGMDGQAPIVIPVHQVQAAVSLDTKMNINFAIQVTLCCYKIMMNPLKIVASTGGYCNQPGECVCHSGYSGDNCEIGNS